MDILSYILGKKAGGGGGEAPVLIDKTITENGTYNASDDGANGYKSVTADVSGGETLKGILDGSLSGDFVYSEPINKLAYARFWEFALLESVSLPNLTGGTNGGAFRNCKNLKKVSAIKATSIGSFTFTNSNKLELAVFPNVNDLVNDSMNNASSLAVVDVKGGIIRNAFNNDSALKTLIIRSAVISNLTAIGAFNNTPFASGGTGGTLYVPSALIASYQAATNWSTILGYANNKILPIEGSIYETQYADGTPIS